MNIRDEYTFRAGPEEVWNHIFDKGALASVIPNCENLTETAPGEYEAVIPVNMILFKSYLAVKINLLEQEKPRFCRFHARAEGELGEMEMEGRMLFEDDHGKTLLKYEADLELSGNIGKLAGRKIESSGKDRIRRSMEELEAGM